LPRAARTLLQYLALLADRDRDARCAAALMRITVSDAEELLDSLVDMHLLDAVALQAGEQRQYRMHTLIRAYAREVATGRPIGVVQDGTLARNGGQFRLGAGQRHSDVVSDHSIAPIARIPVIGYTPVVARQISAKASIIGVRRPTTADCARLPAHGNETPGELACPVQCGKHGL
jgi:hypothetical protein